MKAPATRIRRIIYCLPFLWDLAISKKKRKYSEKPEAKPVLWEAPTGDIQTVGGVVSLAH